MSIRDALRGALSALRTPAQHRAAADELQALVEEQRQSVGLSNDPAEPAASHHVLT